MTKEKTGKTRGVRAANNTNLRSTGRDKRLLICLGSVVLKVEKRAHEWAAASGGVLGERS